MPIYEYKCCSCGERFDKLVRSSSAQQVVSCPSCGSEEVEKTVSLIGISSARDSASPSCTTNSI